MPLDSVKIRRRHVTEMIIAAVRKTITLHRRRDHKRHQAGQ